MLRAGGTHGRLEGRARLTRVGEAELRELSRTEAPLPPHGELVYRMGDGSWVLVTDVDWANWRAAGGGA